MQRSKFSGAVRPIYGLLGVKRLTSFLDFFVEQWLQNQKVHCGMWMWNINMHRYSTNSAVAGWNSKRISSIGSQQPEVFFFLLVQKLKQEAEFVSWQLKPNVESLARNMEK